MPRTDWLPATRTARIEMANIWLEVLSGDGITKQGGPWSDIESAFIP